MKKKSRLAIDWALIDYDKSRIIEMAWEDKTTFDVIQQRYGIDETVLKKLMKEWLTFGSYKLWRKRVRTKSCKHLQIRTVKITRAYGSSQYKLPN